MTSSFQGGRRVVLLPGVTPLQPNFRVDELACRVPGLLSRTLADFPDKELWEVEVLLLHDHLHNRVVNALEPLVVEAEGVKLEQPGEEEMSELAVCEERGGVNAHLAEVVKLEQPWEVVMDQNSNLEPLDRSHQRDDQSGLKLEPLEAWEDDPPVSSKLKVAAFWKVRSVQIIDLLPFITCLCLYRDPV